MSKRRRVLCPTPSKKIYYDEDDARGGGLAALRHIRQSGGNTNRFYCYRCMCGRWHLSGKHRDTSVLITE